MFIFFMQIQKQYSQNRFIQQSNFQIDLNNNQKTLKVSAAVNDNMKHLRIMIK